MKFRIVSNGRGTFQIERRTFFFLWLPLQDYRHFNEGGLWGTFQFKSAEAAQEFLKTYKPEDWEPNKWTPIE